MFFRIYFARTKKKCLKNMKLRKNKIVDKIVMKNYMSFENKNLFFSKSNLNLLRDEIVEKVVDLYNPDIHPKDAIITTKDFLEAMYILGTIIIIKENKKETLCIAKQILKKH